MSEHIHLPVNSVLSNHAALTLPSVHTKVSGGEAWVAGRKGVGLVLTQHSTHPSTWQKWPSLMPYARHSKGVDTQIITTH